ncbi:HesB/YadR/YfhF family protein [Halalkalibacter akibai]|uniref:Core domain-containing protein n=1 Tax=Halalkalibacter akibai (strain ATCC 43226 / DSM 21942 / CIP 109018 / JCM 9157 / 1139) TaxID=1236973 RepID=W4QXT6_HALA3|nr:iron-sulfur cluster biosynthesis family protein [Halalkalibacter akibai]GAE36920.1 hypothetical protein JCM9157_4156 [Halalkalibacter akibai JCM 9157]
MNFIISDEAVALYKKEIPLIKGDSVRLYVRVGGIGSGGFSVGIIKDQPPEHAFILEKQGITFFVTEDDFWYLDGMSITYDEDSGYLDFANPKFSQLDHPES